MKHASAKQRRPPAAIPPPHPKLLEFLAAYAPQIGELALALRHMVIEEAPDACEIVYDAYSAVSIGFTYSGRLKEMFCHIASYGRHVNLGFNRGAELVNREHRLKGVGSQVRHISVKAVSDLDDPALRDFVRLAIDHARLLGGRRVERTVIVKVMSGPKRRPPLP